MQMLKLQGVIDIHTHPFSEETVKGQGLSYTEAHAYFGRSPASPSHHWYKDRTTTPIEDSVAQLKADNMDLAVVVNMNACTTVASCLPNEYIGILQTIFRFLSRLCRHRSEHGYKGCPARARSLLQGLRNR